MNKRRGLTLLELIVVLAIISILLAMLLPAVQSAREKAREAVCKNNVHQINIALGHFAQAHKGLPPPSSPDRIGGWMVEILPFIEQQNLRDAVEIGSPLATAPEALHVPPPVFRCPWRTTLDGDLSQTIHPAHYVLAADSDRDSFSLFDAPVDLNAPWLSGPEMPYPVVIQSKGPHHDGFYCAHGFQQGVDLMLNGRTTR